MGQPPTACFRESLDRCAAMGHQPHGAGALEGLAAVALNEGDPVRAARLLGTAEATRTRLGTPREPAWASFCARTTTAARAVLGDEAFTAAHTAGSASDFAAAATEVLGERASATCTTAPAH